MANTMLLERPCADCGTGLRLRLERKGHQTGALLCEPCLAARVAAVQAEPVRPRWQRTLKTR